MTAEGPVPFTAEEEAEWDAREAEHAARQATLAKTEYQRQRAAEYPPIGDQLDALWKGGDAAAEMLAKVQAVKAKYPKPE
jgi:sRNA-binding protein